MTWKPAVGTNQINEVAAQRRPGDINSAATRRKGRIKRRLVRVTRIFAVPIPDPSCFVVLSQGPPLIFSNSLHSSQTCCYVGRHRIFHAKWIRCVAGFWCNGVGILQAGSWDVCILLPGEIRFHRTGLSGNLTQASEDLTKSGRQSGMPVQMRLNRFFSRSVLQRRDPFPHGQKSRDCSGKTQGKHA